MKRKKQDVSMGDASARGEEEGKARRSRGVRTAIEIYVWSIQLPTGEGLGLAESQTDQNCTRSDVKETPHIGKEGRRHKKVGKFNCTL